MKHSFIDKYSYLNTPIHRIEPLIKIIIFLIFAVLVNLISKYVFFTYPVVFFTLSVIIFISKIPVFFILKKASVILPFLFLIAFCNYFSKSTDYIVITQTVLNSFLIVVSLILLVETTKFHNLLKSMMKLGIPKIIIILLLFIYRYFFVLIDEIERIVLATRLRTHKRLSLKTIGRIIGVIFVRSYERSERIFYAMCSRGFDGNIRILN